MFVVSKIRENILMVLAFPLILAIVYVMIGVFVWMMMFTAPMMPSLSSADMSAVPPSWVVTAANTVWSPFILTTVGTAALAYLFIYRKVSTSYTNRVELLKQINKTIRKIDALSRKGGSIRYTTTERFGPSIIEIITLGSGHFMIKTKGVNAFGAEVNGAFSFEVGDTYFKSRSGVFPEMMRLVRSKLSMAQEYGVSNVKQRIPVGKRLSVRSSGKSFPVGKRNV